MELPGRADRPLIKDISHSPASVDVQCIEWSKFESGSEREMSKAISMLIFRLSVQSVQ